MRYEIRDKVIETRNYMVMREDVIGLWKMELKY